MHRKFLFILVAISLVVASSAFIAHPIFVSVTEIEHNAKESTLEISCKVYTNDFESTLRKTTNAKINLLSPTDKSLMNQQVSNYFKQHLKITADGKDYMMDFIGYEQQEECIVAYFQIDNIKSVKKLVVRDNILYEYKKEQMSLLHVTVMGKRNSTKLLNPEELAVFNF